MERRKSSNWNDDSFEAEAEDEQEQENGGVSQVWFATRQFAPFSVLLSFIPKDFVWLSFDFLTLSFKLILGFTLSPVFSFGFFCCHSFVVSVLFWYRETSWALSFPGSSFTFDMSFLHARTSTIWRHHVNSTRRISRRPIVQSLQMILNLLFHYNFVCLIVSGVGEGRQPTFPTGSAGHFSGFPAPRLVCHGWNEKRNGERQMKVRRENSIQFGFLWRSKLDFMSFRWQLFVH